MENILSFVVDEIVNCSLSRNSILGTYCKVAVHKKGDKILAGIYIELLTLLNIVPYNVL